MGEEKAKKKRHSVGISAVIGIILVTLLIGVIIGGYLSFFVIAPFMQKMQQGSQNDNNQGNTNNPNNNNYNNQNGNNNQITSTSPQPAGDQNNNNNSNQNDDSSQGVNNNNPPLTNPTGKYSAVSCQFNVVIPDNGNQASGTILANVNCDVQQDGNNIQLALTLTPTSIPASLSQYMSNNPVTFNFLGTISNSQINANAAGNMGSMSGSNFDFNLSGTLGSNNLTLSITSAEDSQISVSTPQQISLQTS